VKFEQTTVTKHAPERVFKTYRDELEAVVPHLDTVKRVQRRSRSKHADGRIEQSHLWVGSTSAVPPMLRPMIREEMLTWTDDSVWDATDLTATWRIVLPAFDGAIGAVGTYRFMPHPKGTLVAAQGDFRIDPAKLPPAFRNAVAVVERVIVGFLVPIVASTGEGVSRYMDETIRG
jgi:hypothetical protein